MSSPTQPALAFLAGSATACVIMLLAARLTSRRRQRQAVQAISFGASPHPDWVAGSGGAPPFATDAMVSLDPAELDKASVYAFVISAVVPRPIGFISTQDGRGSRNLSPYSYFNVLGHNPPIVAVGICRSPARGGGKKDTLRNIEETGEFVACIISDWLVEAANHTCGEYDPGVDEMALAGLTPLPSIKVKPPRVAESALHMECVLRHVYEVEDKDGRPSTAVVIGEVVQFHVAEAVTARSPTGKLVVDPVALRPVSRLGGVTYGLTTHLFNLARPDKSGKYGPAAPA